MTTGNTGNGIIPYMGENPEDFSQYSLYQLVGLLHDQLSLLIAQTTKSKDSDESEHISNLKQSMNELVVHLRAQSNKSYNVGGDFVFLIDKINYVVSRLDGHQQVTEKGDKSIMARTAKVWSLLLEIIRRVPQDMDEPHPSRIKSHNKHLSEVRRRAEHLTYDPDHEDNYLGFLLKLLSDELKRNPDVNEQLILGDEKEITYASEPFTIKALYKGDKTEKDKKKPSNNSLINPDDEEEILNEETFKWAVENWRSAIQYKHNSDYKKALSEYQNSLKRIKHIHHKSKRYNDLYHKCQEGVKFCEEQLKKGKGRGNIFARLFSMLF